MEVGVIPLIAVVARIQVILVMVDLVVQVLMAEKEAMEVLDLEGLLQQVLQQQVRVLVEEPRDRHTDQEGKEVVAAGEFHPKAEVLEAQVRILLMEVPAVLVVPVAVAVAADLQTQTTEPAAQAAQAALDTFKLYLQPQPN
jgi:hypothetical protein